MKKLFFLICFSASVSFSFSQYLTPYYHAVNPSGFSIPDGSIVIDSIGGGTPPYLFHYVTSWGIDVVTYGSINLTNLYDGHHYFEVYDANCMFMSFSVVLDWDTAFHTTYTLDSLNFIAESVPGACDGQLYVSMLGGKPYMDFYGWSAMDDFGSYVGGPGSSNPLNVSAVCFVDTMGLQFEAYDFPDNRYMQYKSYDLSKYTMCNGGLFIQMVTVPASDSITCNGSVTTNVWGGVPPYTYSYGSGSLTNTEDSLCPGNYSVTVTDSMGNVGTGNFIISDSSDIYYFLPPTGVPLDTLYAHALANCDLDYMLPIDSVWVDTSFYITPTQLSVSYIIQQDTAYYTWTEVYHMDTSGYIISILNVDCVNGRAAYGSFTFVLSFNTSPFIPVSTDVKEEHKPTKLIAVNAVPNPFTDKVNFYFSSAENGKSETIILDLTGRIVWRSTGVCKKGLNEFNVDLGHLNAGAYIVRVLINDKSSSAAKIIKQ